jgi:hypothetical protein
VWSLGRRISEFEASLVYRVSSRTARSTQRNPVSEKKKSVVINVTLEPKSAVYHREELNDITEPASSLVMWILRTKDLVGRYHLGA